MNNIPDEKNRIFFSKSFKRKALLEFARGIKASDILNKKSKDKKYASKLIHKWRKELYLNPNILALIYENVDFSYAKQEIDLIGDDNEEDDFVEIL